MLNPVNACGGTCNRRKRAIRGRRGDMPAAAAGGLDLLRGGGPSPPWWPACPSFSQQGPSQWSHAPALTATGVPSSLYLSVKFNRSSVRGGLSVPSDQVFMQNLESKRRQVELREGDSGSKINQTWAHPRGIAARRRTRPAESQGTTNAPTEVTSHHPALELPGGGGARPHGDAAAAPPSADDVLIHIKEDKEGVGLAALELAARASKAGVHSKGSSRHSGSDGCQLCCWKSGQDGWTLRAAAHMAACLLACLLACLPA